MCLAPASAFAANVVYEGGGKEIASDDIVLQENGAGAFKEDKYIYLYCKNVNFEDGIKAIVEEGNAKVGNVSSDGSVIKIKISSESTKASRIRLTNVRFTLSRAVSIGTYPLEIVTQEDNDYPDNIFGETYDENSKGFDVKTIVLIKDYITVEKAQENQTENISTDELASNEISVNTGDGAYVNSDGRVMLPLRAITEKVNSSAVVTWDSQTKSATVMFGDRIALFTSESRTMKIKGVDVACVSAPELKDGRMYISIRDLAAFLGISDENIKWDEQSRTVTLNYKE